MDDQNTGFEDATREQWMARVEGVLKGKDFGKTLVGRTADGIAIQPLYERRADAAPVHRAEFGPWRVTQRMDQPNAGEANAQALVDLEGGADALTLVVDGAASAHGFGVKIDSASDLDQALSGVMLDLIQLRIEPGAHGRAIAPMVMELAMRQDQPPASLSLGLDPVGTLAASGSLSDPWNETQAWLADLFRDWCGHGLNGSLVTADGRPYHEAGASEAQELAAVLSTGISYLRTLERDGLSLSDARDAIDFAMAVDADEFVSVAKLRALRRLWARVEEACGLAPKPIHIHVETAWRMMTRRDPWVNMLRATAATFAAGVGGADSIAVLPFTAALGLPDAFARRNARNTSLILRDESQLWRVTDPAAGAGGFEALTNELCAKAWALFQEIEREGGIVASLHQGAVQKRIEATREATLRLVATRRKPITGTSEFPDLKEAPVNVLAPLQSRTERPNADIDPLPCIRDAEPFEALRDRADAYATATGIPPAVFIAALGAVAAHTVRAGFAQNAFAAGGLVPVTGEGTIEVLVEEFRQSGTRLVCLASSDEVYEARANEAAGAFRKAGATVWLAGRPLDAVTGIDGHIHAGSDLVALLDKALAIATQNNP
jgi:methylmalonyl-CoA mutase